MVFPDENANTGRQQFAWFTRGQILGYEHITRVLRSLPYFQKQFNSFPQKLRSLLVSKFKDSPHYLDLLAEGFARTRFGSKFSEGQFPDNLDVTEAIFKFLDVYDASK
jgi:hypothetical protein